MSPALDPLAFALDALEGRGAMAERTGEGAALVLLPAPLARAYGLPEETRLAPQADAEGVVACGFGSTLLERLLAEARADAPVAAVKLDVEPPRVSHATALAGRFVVRNGLSEVVDASVGEALYVRATLGYVAEADDRHEGTLALCAASDGAVPDGALCDALDPLALPIEARASGEPVSHVGQAAASIAWRTERAVRSALADVVAASQRRHARDHARIAEYYAAVALEARGTKRKIDPGALVARIEHLQVERDAKLRELAARYAMRVRATPAGALCATVPSVRVRVRVRRRKEAREWTLRLPALGRALDRPGCEGCGEPAARPAVCDERFHALCEACVPNPQGRIECPACAREDAARRGR